MNRRGFIGALLAAPAIVRAEWLMPVMNDKRIPFPYVDGGRVTYRSGMETFDWAPYERFKREYAAYLELETEHE